MTICKKCNNMEIMEGEKFCVICLLKERGLPWMNKFKVRHLLKSQVAFIVIDNKEYLLTPAGDGMLFTKEEAQKAEDRFRGEVEL